MAEGAQIEEVLGPWSALRRIVQVLGPETAGCGDCCEGCNVEMSEALRIARQTLGIAASVATEEER